MNQSVKVNNQPNAKLKLFGTLIGAVLFNVIFWKQDLGLNLFIFNVFVVAVSLFLNPKAVKSRWVWYSGAGAILASFGVLVINSFVSKTVSILAIISFVGMVQNESLKSIWYSFKTGLINFFRVPDIFKSVKVEKSGKPSKSFNISRGVQLAIVPILILFVFFLIFIAANPMFRELTWTAFESLDELFKALFDMFSFQRILFFFVGLIILSWAFYKGTRMYFVKKEAGKKLQIFRMKKNKPRVTRDAQGNIVRRKFPFVATLALKNENLIGVLTTGLVGLLLTVVNVIDIIFVWFKYDPSQVKDFSADVHQGTYLLIFSILLSIGIMCYFFRANQNFYSKNYLLKKLTYVWLAQNIILVVSVVLRNWHYIEHQGLTHKRIGVFMFLALVLFGLGTMFVKVSQKRSLFFLTMNNSWAVFGLFVILSLFNWDNIIVKNNLAYPNSEIDHAYLLTLSDQAIIEVASSPEWQAMYGVIDKSDVDDAYTNSSYYDANNKSDRYRRKLSRRLYDIKIDMANYKKDLWSWSYRRDRIRQYMEFNYGE